MMKKLLYIVIALGALYVILCFFGPAKIKVERQINIHYPSKEKLQHKLADLKFFHEQWSPWTKLDPLMKATYSGVCCEPGSTYEWESPKDSVGKGKITFMGFKGDSVLHTLHFDGMGDDNMYYITKTLENEINVTWGMAFDVGFFGRAPMLFIDMDEMIGKSYEEGLMTLKTILETSYNDLEAQAFDIQETEWELRYYYGKRSTLAFSEMENFFGENYSKISGYLQQKKINMIGSPSAIYFSFDEEKGISDCAAVMGIDKPIKPEDFELFEIPKSKVLYIDYYGAYNQSAKAHYAMDAFMKNKNLTQKFVIEEYVTDPMAEKDTAKWLTKIYYVLN
jgi:effector-binding domain-containing protein